MRFGVITTVLILVLTATAVGFSRSGDTAQPVFAQGFAAIAPNLLPLSGKYTPPPHGDYGLREPVDGFLTRATIKHFGTYITPDTSPVEGDRFTGYHTGVDAEFTDTVGDVAVRAIADGTVIARTWANGYGGVVVIRHIIGGVPVFALYGHLDEASFVPGVTAVKAGDVIGVLGDDHSQETDGVRKHLHFSLYTGEKIDYRGYVPTQTDLAPWLDPLAFF